MNKTKNKNTHIANNLLIVRKSIGLSQRAVAAALYIDRSTYTCWELGRSEPNYNNLKRIIDFFNKFPLPITLSFQNLLDEDLAEKGFFKTQA